MKIVCIKPGYEGRTVEADRELEDRFETDVVAYGQPGLATYSKADWKLAGDLHVDMPLQNISLAKWKQ